MSHLTSYKSEVLVNTSKILLKRAVNDLGLELDFEKHLAKNSYVSKKVDAVFCREGKPLSLGIIYTKENGKNKVTVEGDFYCTGVCERTFIDQIAQSYKKHEVLQKCKEQGWTVYNENISLDKETNEIVIEASRYVV